VEGEVEAQETSSSKLLVLIETSDKQDEDRTVANAHSRTKRSLDDSWAVGSGQWAPRSSSCNLKKWFWWRYLMHPKGKAWPLKRVHTAHCCFPLLYHCISIPVYLASCTSSCEVGKAN
jgi:hypothetical protein